MTIFLNDEARECLDLYRVRDIAREGCRLEPFRSQLFNIPFDIILGTGGEDDFRPLPGVDLGYRPSQASAGSGNNGNFIFKCFHGCGTLTCLFFLQPSKMLWLNQGSLDYLWDTSVFPSYRFIVISCGFLLYLSVLVLSIYNVHYIDKTSTGG